MTVTRPRYRERQPLRAADLNDEQAYRITMRRRHNVAHHGWGIVTGLAPAAEPDSLWVQPGMAVDGFGRELIVPAPVAVPAGVFDQLESEAVDVWLVYGRVGETPPQRGRWACGPDQQSRWREEARLRLTPADDNLDPRRPADVSDADLDFAPYETPPDDPGRAWPVYLGRIRRDGTAYAVELANRPYATLVGELIRAPSGRAQMQVGSELAGDRRRFAVSLPDETVAFTDRLVIDRAGDTTIRGHTTLAEGDLVVADAEPDTSWGIAFLPLATPPEAAAPWQIYRTVVTQDDVAINQLRLEIGHPGEKGDPTRYRLVIGHTDAGGDFVPCLTVSADCTVTVHGDLRPLGQVLEGPIQADPDDPRFGAALLDRWVRGLAGAGTEVDAFYAGDLDVGLDAPSSVDTGATLSYTVTVHNTGRGAVTDIQVHENLAVAGTPARQESITSGLTLGAGESQNFDRSFAVPDDDGLVDEDISLALTALGVGPAGNVVQASISQTIQITAPIIIE